MPLIEKDISDAVLRKIVFDPDYFIETMVSIRTESQGVAPFILNETQRAFSRTRTGRDIILKSRRHGFSTYILARGLHKALTAPGSVVKIVCHIPDTRDELFDNLRIMFNNLPDWFKPKTGYENRNELTFPELDDSRIAISTAGDSTDKAEGLGRGGTIHLLHCSEFAFWSYPSESYNAVKECVPLPHQGGEMYIESTANGHNFYWKMWIDAKAGKSVFTPQFFSWAVGDRYHVPVSRDREKELLSKTHPDRLTEEELRLIEKYGLTLTQINWRRVKLAESGTEARFFPREYPLNDKECFLMSGRPFFDVELVNAQLEDGTKPKPFVRWEDGSLIPKSWRVFRYPNRNKSYVAGVDCAEGLEHGDNDSITILDRQTGEEVCHIWGSFGTDLTTRHIIHANTMFGGNVYWGIEDSKHGQTVLSNLLNYEKFPRKLIHHYTDWDIQKKKTYLKPGWNTNMKSRPMMLDDLDSMYEKQHIKIYDDDQLGEFLTFVVGKDGTPKAQDKANDDTVISAAIAVQMLKYKPYKARGMSRTGGSW